MRRFAVLLAVLCLPAAIAANGASAAGCPNEALRSGPSALLPGCRAYEMVSPVDKNGGNVSSNLSVHAAPGGGAVSFISTASFAGAVASPLASTYIARRGSNWATESVDPEQFNHNGLVVRGTPTNSSDLSHSFGVSRLALTPGAVDGGSNVYVRDNATGALTLLTSTPGGAYFNEASGIGGGSFLGASADMSNVLVESDSEPLPVPSSGPQPVPGQNNLYELSGGEARLVNVLPDGTVDPSGAHSGGGNSPYQHRMSEDGTRVFFQLGSNSGTGALYMREDGTTTVPISVSQNGAEAGQVEPAEFGFATPDGSVVYFSSGKELLAGAGGSALYRYDVPTQKLSAVIANPPAGGVGVSDILAGSDDGSYVYFSSDAVLAEGAPASGAAANFYVAHDGQVKFVGHTVPEDLEFNSPRQWSVSPNGKFFGMTSASPMTAEDRPSPACPTDLTVNNAPEHCFDVYVFSYETGHLTCASCKGQTNAKGEWEWLPGRGFSELGGQQTHEQGTGDEFPRPVLNDGTFFFDTPNALSPRDANGVGDVYAWRDGSAELISTGKGEQPSNFGDATRDGSDVYFLTKQQLVPQDTDESTDLYDDRELGGLASQWPPGSEPPCKGEGCRGASPAAPAGLPAGTAAAPTKAGGPTCAALRTQAKKAENKARRLTKRARRGGKGSSAHSRRLRREATTARTRAHRIHQKAVTCGRKH